MPAKARAGDHDRERAVLRALATAARLKVDSPSRLGSLARTVVAIGVAIGLGHPMSWLKAEREGRTRVVVTVG